MLLTRISGVGYPPGWWTLPGGGIEHGESPDDAVRREVYEETSLRCRSVRLVTVHDVHTKSSGRNDQWEDYHGIHLLYAIDVDPDQATEVLEVGGSTDRAAWIPITQIVDGDMSILPMVEHAITHRDLFGG